MPPEPSRFEVVKFIHKDLGNRKRGDIVVIELSAWANVRLMTGSNLNSYRNRRRHDYHGGLVKQSPFRLTIPSPKTRHHFPAIISWTNICTFRPETCVHRFHAQFPMLSTGHRFEPR